MFARKIRVDWLAETVAKESIKSIKAVSATKLTPAQLRTNQWSLGFPGFRHQGASVWAPGAAPMGKDPSRLSQAMVYKSGHEPETQSDLEDSRSSGLLSEKLIQLHQGERHLLDRVASHRLSPSIDHLTPKYKGTMPWCRKRKCPPFLH